MVIIGNHIVYDNACVLPTLFLMMRVNHPPGWHQAALPANPAFSVPMPVYVRLCNDLA